MKKINWKYYPFRKSEREFGEKNWTNEIKYFLIYPTNGWASFIRLHLTGKNQRGKIDVDGICHILFRALCSTNIDGICDAVTVRSCAWFACELSAAHSYVGNSKQWIKPDSRHAQIHVWVTSVPNKTMLTCHCASKVQKIIAIVRWC